MPPGSTIPPRLVEQLIAEPDQRYAEVSVTLAFPSKGLDPAEFEPPEGAFVIGEDERVDRYGEFVGNAFSVCFEKALPRTRSRDAR